MVAVCQSKPEKKRQQLACSNAVGFHDCEIAPMNDSTGTGRLKGKNRKGSDIHAKAANLSGQLRFIRPVPLSQGTWPEPALPPDYL
jgi:hypothetical protein